LTTRNRKEHTPTENETPNITWMNDDNHNWRAYHDDDDVDDADMGDKMITVGSQTPTL